MKLLALLLLVSGAAFAATEENTNKTFPASPGGALVVDVDFGTIAVNTNEASAEIAVEVWRKITRTDKDAEEKFLRENPIQFLQEGGNLTVRCRSSEIRWFSGWRHRNEAKYTIRVPARFHAKLHTSGGGIAVSDLTGEVSANTSGGGLRFTRVQGPLIGDTSGGGISVTDCGGTIHIHTSGGGIDVAGGNGSLDGETSGGGVSVKDFGGPVSVKTSGGGMTIEKIAGKVSASTSGGSIKAVLLSPVPGDVALSTSGGGVTVKAPENALFNIDAETSGGGVTCDLPTTVEGKMKHGRLKGVVNGGGPAVVLRSSGGGIQIKRL